MLKIKKGIRTWPRWPLLSAPLGIHVLITYSTNSKVKQIVSTLIQIKIQNFYNVMQENSMVKILYVIFVKSGFLAVIVTRGCKKLIDEKSIAIS